MQQGRPEPTKSELHKEPGKYHDGPNQATVGAQHAASPVLSTPLERWGPSHSLLLRTFGGVEETHGMGE